MLENIKKELASYGNEEKSRILSRFFKTKPGEYGHGDVFLGLKVPETRAVAKKYIDLNLKDVEILLKSGIHEERLDALLILVEKYNKSNENYKKIIFDFYLNNAKNVNNWDLVDLSADKIVGSYLINKDKKILYKLVKSENLWERRISIIATFAFIRKNNFNETFKISESLMKDKHDLIHKAVGWMLREAGKRNQAAEEQFLKKYYKNMPRTMLRYAIEKFDKDKKEFFYEKIVILDFSFRTEPPI